MKTFYYYINRVFDFILAPLSGVSISINIVILSIVSSIFILVLFKKISNQRMIKIQKDKIYGNLILIVMYSDQPRIMLNAIFSIFRYNIIYLRYAFTPICFIFIPIFIISIQVNNRFGYAPIVRNQNFIIRAELQQLPISSDNVLLDGLRCKATKGIAIETEPLRIASERTVLWRARLTDASSPQFIRIAEHGNQWTVEKKVITSLDGRGFRPGKSKFSIWKCITGDCEHFISANLPVKTVSVSYQRMSYPFLLWHTDPIVLYFVYSLIFSLVFKPLFRVSI